LDQFEAFARFLADEKIPSMNMIEFADWWNRRGALQILGIQWDQNAGQLRFTILAGVPVDNATVILPNNFQGQFLRSLSVAGGASVDSQTTLLDGQEYAMAVLPRIQGRTNLIAAFS
jgi:hypothetical protein